MKNSLIVNIQTLNDIQSWEVGEQILRPVFSVEKLKPQRVATFGEVTKKHGFDVEALSDCKAHWAKKAAMRVNGVQRDILEDFNWKRAVVAKSQGSVTFPSTNMKNIQLSGGLFFESQFRNEIDWSGIFTTWCSVLSPYAAILHPGINLDQSAQRKRDVRKYSFEEEITRNAWSRFSTGIFHCEFRAGDLNSLVSGFTNLGWASFFGGNFVEEVDEAVISAAGFPIQRVGGGYMVQVTDDISDVINDFPTFSERRAKLKSLFRDGLFLINDEPNIF
ncbi:hypothetical protein [Nitrincola sp. MINF-07-Sa-05]|uniref:hypothetical protein n=1 Tax=Nitrincola salilacus TaxID=3400273 RepID=UPI0039183E0B